MTTVLDTAILVFQPRDQEFCPIDDGGGEALYYFGEVVCPGCGRATPVAAALGETESGYCWRCQTLISVQVDPRHFRMDDSRPRSSGHGCDCGNPRCRWWEGA